MSEQFTQRITAEIRDFIASRRSLTLSTLNELNEPYTSYAPFALDAECIYVLLSEIALHALYLQSRPVASALIIEDEGTAEQLFARVRVNLSLDAIHIKETQDEWQHGIETLAQRHGERINNLSSMSDFKLFRLVPKDGRYVKGFGKAFSLEGNVLVNPQIVHLKEGHKKR
ncbi:MAG: HugZ family protein [Pontibacterium sp.]